MRLPAGFDVVMLERGIDPPAGGFSDESCRAYVVALLAAIVANLDYVDLAESLLKLNHDPLVH